MPRNEDELFSEKVKAKSRTYFFNVKEASDGSKYLVINESRKAGEGNYERHRIWVFEEHLDDFRRGFEKAIDFMEQLE
ncbi:MAG: DUF3276 family protein [candidate division Zixibacteria bacterium]|nr:DUF3276 family protein [Candidatus Tariuqbacter arcticus]